MHGYRDLASRLLATIILALSAGRTAQAAAPVSDVLATPLAPLIGTADSPERFAVPLPLSVSMQTRGAWTRSASTMSWSYTLSVPEAVSLSFHAAHIRLSPHAQLVVTGGGKNYTYTSKDVHRGQLWSRIARGNSLEFKLRVPVAEAASVYLSIDSAQAGYRSLDGRGPNHPHYDQLRRQSAAMQAVTAGCQENFDCHATAANQGAGHATMALIINNQYQCTGVLLNDVPQDGKPYVLTARHCQNGNSDGGDPSAASGISAYWDALTPCGGVLGTIYDPQVVWQSGAVTMVEQQDAWLVKLDQPPAVTDAWFIGWDASESTINGGYTVHHGDGSSKQYVGWNGKAVYLQIPAASLGVHYDSTFWGTVNAVGNLAPGASGSGLFDANDRLVGVVVRAKVDGSDEGVCPANPPPAPSPSTQTALSTALSGIFASTADPVSTTGAATLQSVLDPGATGAFTLDGVDAPPYVTLLLNTSGPANTGLAMDLKWFAPADSTCTATGGSPGDGWGGPIPSTGDQWVNNYTGGTVDYTVSCTRGSRTGVASLQLDWQLSPPQVYLLVGSLPGGVNTPFTLYWNSNLGPCSGSGGAAGNGWNGPQPAINGTAQISEPASGTFTYTITCGSGARTASSQVTLIVQKSAAALYGDADSLLVGQSVLLQWSGMGQPCVATGGVPGDGWAGTQIGSLNGGLMLTETAPGTYVYQLTCGPATDQATAQLTLNFTAGSPSVTLSASPSLTPDVGPFATTTMSWNSNVRPCSLVVAGPEPGNIYTDGRPQSSVLVGQDLMGSYTYTITCGVAPNTASASLNLTYGGTPSVSITNSMPTMVKGVGETIGYLTNILPCVATGGAPNDGWAGTYTDRNRNIVVNEAQAGTYTYVLTCGSGAQTAQTQVTVVVLDSAPAVTISADQTSTLYGMPVVLTWNSNQPGCTASGGGPGDGWPGTVAGSGSATVTEGTAGDVTYLIDCGPLGLSASASVTVSYNAYPAPDLRASTTSAIAGQPITLTWQSASGAACVASGGLSGDGWAGVHPASGSLTLTESGVGTVIYQMSCGVSQYAEVDVNFQAAPDVPPPLPVGVQLTAAPTSLTVGQMTTLTWAAQNANACTASGGGSGDTWPGDLSAGGGSRQVAEQTAGTYTYSVSCNAGTESATAQASVTYTAPPPPNGGGSGGGGGGGGAVTWLDLLLIAIFGARVKAGTPVGSLFRAAPTSRDPR